MLDLASTCRPLRCRPLVTGLGVLILTVTPAWAQTLLWTDRISSESSDEFLAGAPDGSGGVFAAGYSGNGFGGPFGYSRSKALLVRYDALGRLLWARRFGGGPGARVDCAASDAAGGVFLTGMSIGSPAELPATWMGRFDGSGNPQWIQPQSTSTYATYAVPDGQGGFLLCGWTSYCGAPASWAGRFDSAGTRSWSKVIFPDCAGGDETHAITSDGLGGAFVCGQAWLPNFSDDVWLARLDAAGQVTWTATLASPKYDVANSVMNDGSGGVYVGGRSQGDISGTGMSLGRGWLARYDANGNLMWLRQDFGPGCDAVRRIAPDGAGGLFAGIGYSGKIWLERIDGQGTTISSQQTPPKGNPPLGFMAPDQVGGVYLGGGGNKWMDPGNYDAWISRYGF